MIPSLLIQQPRLWCYNKNAKIIYDHLQPLKMSLILLDLEADIHHNDLPAFNNP